MITSRSVLVASLVAVAACSTPPPKEPAKEEDRQLNKAIEILKDPSKITATKKAA